MADRTMKRNDTYEPITGIASTPAGRVDLGQFTALMFRAKASVAGASVTVAGVAEDVETVDGSGGIDPDDGLPVNRGRYRYQQIAADTAISGLYEIELECALQDGRLVTFPNAKASNPTIQIDDDIA